MNADDERAFEGQLEKIGERFRPTPGPRFYRRLARAPWQGDRDMVTDDKPRARRWAVGAVEVLAVLLVLIVVGVMAGSQWLGGLVPGGSPQQDPTATPTLVGACCPVVPGGTATPLPGQASVLKSQKIIVIDPRTAEIIGGYDTIEALQANQNLRAAGRVLFYILGAGESYESVAAALGLHADSLAWSNPTLAPNVGDMLFVPPVDGVVHHVEAGDTVVGLAYHYQVSVEAITNYAPNGLNGDPAQLQITQLLVIPGGVPRAETTTLPTITREAEGRASDEPGACAGPFSGPVGAATFVWPVDTGSYGFNIADFVAGEHPGLDLAVDEGAPVYATDVGVVVFAGWSDSGYGNVVIIDHGNGWQSVYGHLGTVAVVCGQAVEAGSPIATAGSTGKLSGIAVYFELIKAGVGPVDPSTVLP